jgi:hypothetical protein
MALFKRSMLTLAFLVIGVLISSADQGTSSLNGNWQMGSRPTAPLCQVIQQGNALTFINEKGEQSSGSFIDASTVVANDWNGLKGTISADGNRIDWANGSWWVRSSTSNLNGNNAEPTTVGPLAGDTWGNPTLPSPDSMALAQQMVNNARLLQKEVMNKQRDYQNSLISFEEYENYLKTARARADAILSAVNNLEDAITAAGGLKLNIPDSTGSKEPIPVTGYDDQGGAWMSPMGGVEG